MFYLSSDWADLCCPQKDLAPIRPFADRVWLWVFGVDDKSVRLVCISVIAQLGKHRHSVWWIK